MQTNKIQLLNTKESILTAPATIGVYQFISANEILYTGKSVNLRARLLSHLENSKIDPKEAAIVCHSKKINLFVTDSELNALLLESQLIRTQKPKFNVRWRDDKSFLYVVVNLKDRYPKFQLARQSEINKNTLAYGPFPSVRTASYILREIRKVFPYCSQKKVGEKPCFYSKIGLCSPCPNIIDQISDKEEKKKSKRKYLKNIKGALRVLDGESELIINSLHKKLKQLIKQKNYEEAIKYRNKILTLERLMTEKKLNLDNLVEDYNQSEKSLSELKSLLIRYFDNLTSLDRIECYDVSNLNFSSPSSSLVVFTSGLANKKEYRRFRIKEKQNLSDTKMLEETLRRRLQNRKWPYPNLIIVDGGKPQIRTVVSVLNSFNLSIPLVGIAKNPDRLIIGKRPYPTIYLDLNNYGFNLVRAIRDESHRFSRKYHLFLRHKEKML